MGRAMAGGPRSMQKTPAVLNPRPMSLVQAAKNDKPDTYAGFDKQGKKTPGVVRQHVARTEQKRPSSATAEWRHQNCNPTTCRY
jgi:hypothetical protein